MSNSFKRTVYGIGYLGTDETGRPMRTVDETGKVTRAYKVWYNMIQRCYSGKYPSYENVTVCDRWLCYSTFLEDLPKIKNYDYWMSHPNEGIALNKDLFYVELGIETDYKVYSLETTRFISKKENMKEVSERTEPPHKIRKVKATNVATGEMIEFDSIRQASREIKSNGTDRTREKKIGECLNGKGKSAYGYYWEFVD